MTTAAMIDAEALAAYNAASADLAAALERGAPTAELDTLYAIVASAEALIRQAPAA